MLTDLENTPAKSAPRFVRWNMIIQLEMPKIAAVYYSRRYNLKNYADGSQAPLLSQFD